VRPEDSEGQRTVRPEDGEARGWRGQRMVRLEDSEARGQ